jgi:TolB protein
MKKLLAVFLTVAVVYSQKQVFLEVSADRSEAIPIGIVMFQPIENSPVMSDVRPWETIVNDLDFTGNFLVKKINSADPAFFLLVQIPVYISGTYFDEKDSVTMNIYLYDAGKRDLLLGKTYRFHKKDANLIAHRYSATVYKTLLGEDAPYESKIVYVETNDGGKNIVLCDYDGKNKSYLTKNGINIMPSFIDKQNILCVSYDKGKPDIYAIDISQGKKTLIFGTRKVESSPNYSDITGRILLASSKSGNMEVYSVDREGSDEQRLTVGSFISTAPNWSPNGYKIAFVSDRSGSPQIYVADRTGANVQRITFGGIYHDSPNWSPDGSKIAYTAQRNGKKMIAVSLTNGSEEELITEEISGHQEYPSWSPDGSHILFTLTQGGRTNICAIRLKDKRLLKITTNGNSEQSKWSGF